MTILANEKARNEKENTNSNTLTTNDPAFQAIQISQIMVLECWLLREQISKENQDAMEMISSLEKHAAGIGKMMHQVRKNPGGK